MNPTREPRSSAAEPTAPRDLLTDDAVVDYLRTRAPGLPTARFDAGSVTSRARGALRRRRLRNVVLVVAGAAAAYLALALAGPLPVPGLGATNVPGDGGIRDDVGSSGDPRSSDKWQADVDRLETEVLPVVEDLRLSYYHLEPAHGQEGPCRNLEYSRGDFSDPGCREMKAFDPTAVADFDEVTGAVERSGVAVERIYRYGDWVFVQLEDTSWQYNWQYVYMPNLVTPPPTNRPEENWTQIRGDWWIHRAHDD
jgi:hypothetical protein